MLVSKTRTALLYPLIFVAKALSVCPQIKERKIAIRVCDSDSKIAEHANQCGHNIDFDQATIVDKVQYYHKRFFLEAWHSQRD